MDWISPETSFAPSLRSGTPSLRLSLRPELAMDTSAECSASLSLNATRNKSRPLATPRTHDRSLSVKRCRRSWLPSARNQPSEISSRSGKYLIFLSNCLLVNLLIIIYSFSLSDEITKEISSACYKIFPLENVLIRKVKVLKKPKFDLTKLMELYSSKADAIRPIATPGEKWGSSLRTIWVQSWRQCFVFTETFPFLAF